MKDKYKNLSLKKVDEVYKDVFTGSRRLLRHHENYSVVTINGDTSSELQIRMMLDYMKEQNSEKRVRLFDISKSRDCQLYEEVILKSINVLDEEARLSDCLIFIHDYNGYSMKYYMCKFTNVLFVDWGSPDSPEALEPVKLAAKMLSIYPHLPAQSVKSAILNSIEVFGDGDLRHLIHNDSSLRVNKLLYSSPRRVNLTVEGRREHLCKDDFIINFPDYVRVVRITITVVTLCNRTVLGGDPYIDNECVRAVFPTLTYCRHFIKKIDEFGNLQRIIIEIDFDIYRGLRYRLPIIFKSYGNSVVPYDKAGDEPKFYANIMVEMDDFPDYKCERFYQDMKNLNNVCE
jgi:hypothetical protein